MKEILVIAAGGKTGRRVATKLEAAGHKVRRASRSADIPFDWEDQSTWRKAIEGVDAAYVVYTPDLAVPSAAAAIRGFVALAEELQVKKIVLLSGRGEDEAQACEQIALTSGVPTTVVRASWFAQNFDEGEFNAMVESGVVHLPLAEVREPFIDVDDIADVAVAALTENGHDGKVYEVTGPRLLTFGEAIAEIAKASGSSVEFVPVPMDDFCDAMKAEGMPEDFVGLLRYLFTITLSGKNSYLSHGVEEALGRKPKDFSDYARDAASKGAWAAKQLA